MKRLVCGMLSLVLCMFCTSAFAEVDLQAIEDANVVVNVPDAYPSFAQHVTYYDMETGEAGEPFSGYTVYDEEGGLRFTYVLTNGDVQIWGGGKGCGYVKDSGTPYVCGFVGGTYEENMLSLCAQNLGEFFGGQTVVAEETSSSGKMLLTVETPITAETSGYEQFAGSTMIAYYTINPENLVIEASDVCIRGEDGVDHPYITAWLEVDPSYTPPFDVEALDAAEKWREVRVILDPGAENEVEYVLEAPLTVPMMIYIPAGYDLFEDEALTVPMTNTEPDENGNYPETATLYCAPAAK